MSKEKKYNWKKDVPSEILKQIKGKETIVCAMGDFARFVDTKLMPGMQKDILQDMYDSVQFKGKPGEEQKEEVLTKLFRNTLKSYADKHGIEIES